MDADRYLCMVERLVNEHPEIAVSESGIVQRIMVFRKNGLPKPKRDEDSEQEYRKYKNQIETTLNRYMRSKEYDTSSLQQVVELIEKMTCMPEHEFFKNTCIGILDSICYDVVLFEKVIQEFRNIRIEESRCG